MSPRLFLISGMTGAGKTTLARQLEAETGAIRFCPDEWLLELMHDVHDRAEMDRLRTPVEGIQWRIAQNLLGQGLDVVLENGFWKRSERLGYLERAHELGASVTLYFLDPSRDELLRRITARNRLTTERALQIDALELDRWLERLERPDQVELDRYDDVRLHQ